MTGIAALALCAGFTSCSHNDDFEPITQDQIDKAKYDQAFLAYVGGKIASNQDWGFSASTTTRGLMTRTNNGETYPATSKGINANANEWADPNKKFGGWVVPDVLTDGQKERVRKYFQANPNLTYQDPQWRHFFVQQVYKGKTSVGTNSSEVVVAANNSQYDSNNMNLLTVGENNQHINNYNAGDCSSTNVLDNGSYVNGGSYHSDKIMLMVNIDDTSCFGYHQTGISLQHNDKAALVSAAVIDEWASKNGNPGEAVTDKWNRSFLGFDLALLEGTDALDATTVKYNDGPESYNYAMIDGKVESIDGNSEILVNGEPVKYATVNTNMFIAADKKTIGDSEIQAEYRVNGQYMGKYINVDNIMALLSEGWVPVKDKNLREWVKIGVSDGYFSDWIVTLTEAKRMVVEEQYDLRIWAEDLSAAEAGDFDFNDIVLDVKYDNSNAIICLRAAGGTLPLRIAGKDEWEVHKLFKEANEGKDITTKTMINTAAGKHNEYKPAVVETHLKVSTPAEANTVLKLEVFKNNKWQEMEAPLGEPSCKLAVDKDLPWLNERASIKGEYEKFVPWAQDNEPNLSKWWIK